MKQITLISGKVLTVEDGEAENIKQAASRGGFVELRDGTLVNTSSISIISEPEKKAYWSIYEVQENKNGKFINREGEQCFLSPENIKEITMRNEYDQTRLLQEGIQWEKPVLYGGM